MPTASVNFAKLFAAGARYSPRIIGAPMAAASNKTIEIICGAIFSSAGLVGISCLYSVCRIFTERVLVVGGREFPI